MWRKIFLRVLLIFPQLFMMSILVFALSTLMPGDALTGKISPLITTERMAELKEQMGLNKSPAERYIQWMGDIFQGDFGTSYSQKIPVIELVGDKAFNSFVLGITSLLLAYAIGLQLGAYAGHFNTKLPDKIITGYTYFLLAVPIVVFALLNILVFSLTLNILPIGGSIDIGMGSENMAIRFLSRLRHIILPAITASAMLIPMTVQLLRSEWIDAKKRGYILALYARGLPEKLINKRHILPGAAIPLTSLTGSFIVSMLSGLVLIESTFSYQGLGKLFLDSVASRDYPVANFLVLLIGSLIAVFTLLTDILLYKLDPRITTV